MVRLPLTQGSYSHFLEVANRAHREATPKQRDQIRQLTSNRRLGHERYAEEISKIMGWS